MIRSISLPDPTADKGVTLLKWGVKFQIRISYRTPQKSSESHQACFRLLEPKALIIEKRNIKVEETSIR